MKPIGHSMILASAGSGKTYALTNRYVRLLARGVRPERIAALTFTRRAAGEFFDEILKKLAHAAGDEDYARKLAAEIDVSATGADFIRLLRGVIAAMPRLNLGTLDGFFARIVRAFPLELGLGGDFDILESHAARLERRRVLRRMFARSGGAPEAAQLDFIEAFKRATFGVEEKRLGPRLDAFLDEHSEIYLEAGEAEKWGRPERIWPQATPWLTAAGSRSENAAALSAALPWPLLTEKQRGRWETFFATLPDWAPGAPLPKPVAYIFRNAFAAWPELAEMTVDYKPLALPPAARTALKQLLIGLVGAELSRRLEMTRGIFAVLRGYETVYDGMVRRNGRLTFADLQRLLRPETGGPVLSREAMDEARLFIDWRLDAQIEHWLLDEFQDTSLGQWSVLRNLIDEAVQDPEGTRSLFYVGDVKQAIFAWRGGDSRLFREIYDRYNVAAPGFIQEETLLRSYRSGPAVISMVNKVFGDPGPLRRLFPAEAVDRWAAEWGEHTSENQILGGHAELLHAQDEAGRFAETLRILEQVRPLDRGLSAAILVPTNRTGAELADFLRRQGGLPAVAESDLQVGIDNPLTCGLLALFRAAAHPGDRAAWLHVGMTPLAGILAEQGVGTVDVLTTLVLGEIHAGGFEGASEIWLRALEPYLAPDDRFSRERGRQFLAAAREFDDTGRREVAEFVQFIERYTVRDIDAAGIIRVMTVHKAKGLGFDLVILPDLEGNTLAERRDGLAVQKNADRSVDWILQLPSRDFFAHDPVLSAHVAAAEADACYEKFCLLYVAMTRAKRAMYVITEPVGTSESPNFPRLLRDTLGDTWTAGDPLWFETVPKLAAVAEAAETASPELGDAARMPRRQARRPSAERAGTIGAARLFTLDAAASREFGDAVHALLARVEWADAAELASLAAAWGQQGEAGTEAAACLLAPDLAVVWHRPAADAEVWRERSFEVVLDEAWVSGVFDRVVVRSGPDGRAQSATVYDFKTDRRHEATELAAAAAVHLAQMSLYRRAVAVLLGLDPAAVSAEVVFTHFQRRVAG